MLRQRLDRGPAACALLKTLLTFPAATCAAVARRSTQGRRRPRPPQHSKQEEEQRERNRLKTMTRSNGNRTRLRRTAMAAQRRLGCCAESTTAETAVLCFAGAAVIRPLPGSLGRLQRRFVRIVSVSCGSKKTKKMTKSHRGMFFCCARKKKVEIFELHWNLRNGSVLTLPHLSVMVFSVRHTFTAASWHTLSCFHIYFC